MALHAYLPPTTTAPTAAAATAARVSQRAIGAPADRAKSAARAAAEGPSGTRTGSGGGAIGGAIRAASGSGSGLHDLSESGPNSSSRVRGSGRNGMSGSGASVHVARRVRAHVAAARAAEITFGCSSVNPSLVGTGKI